MISIEQSNEQTVIKVPNSEQYHELVSDVIRHVFPYREQSAARETKTATQLITSEQVIEHARKTADLHIKLSTIIKGNYAPFYRASLSFIRDKDALQQFEKTIGNTYPYRKFDFIIRHLGFEKVEKILESYNETTKVFA